MVISPLLFCGISTRPCHPERSRTAKQHRAYARWDLGRISVLCPRRFRCFASPYGFDYRLRLSLRMTRGGNGRPMVAPTVIRGDWLYGGNFIVRIRTTEGHSYVIFCDTNSPLPILHLFRAITSCQGTCGKGYLQIIASRVCVHVEKLSCEVEPRNKT